MHSLLIRFLIGLLCIFLIANIVSCGGGSSNNESGEDKDLIVFSGFEEESSLNEWEISSGNSNPVFLDDTESYEGNSSLLVDTDQCVNLAMKEFLPVVKGEIYEVSFAVKRSGSYVGCAGAFILLITQSDEDLMYESSEIQELENWQVIKYYFQADNDDPVKLSLIIGYEMMRIDNIQVKVWEVGSSGNQDEIVSVGFEDEADLSGWGVFSGNSNPVSLDDTTSYEGYSSLRVATDQCVHMTMKESLHVTAGTTYQMSVAVKRSGPYVGCAGAFILLLTQSGEDLMYESSQIQDGEEWEIQTFQFESESDVPVKLHIYIGYQTVWIDDIRVNLF